MWYVLYTRSRAEKRVTENLERMKLEVYCPMTTEVRQWSDRKKKVTEPLFKSYVFVRLKEKERHKVFDVPGVVKYLYWLGKPALVRDAEIDIIKAWLNDDAIDEVKVDHLNSGDKVTILSGAFKDEEAVIEEIGPKRVRLVLIKLGCIISVRTREIIASGIAV